MISMRIPRLSMYLWVPKTLVADASAGLRSPTVSAQATFQFMSWSTSAEARTRASPSLTHCSSMTRSPSAVLVALAQSVTSSR